MLYTQSHQPAGQLGDCWSDSGTGTFKAMGGGGWVTLFYFNMTNGGLLPLGGGIMNGPILGAHGLLGSNNPRMTGTPTLNDDDLCTVDQMRDYIKAQIELAIGSTTTTGGGGTPTPPPAATLRTTVAFGMGSRPAASSPSGTITIGNNVQSEWPYFTEDNGTTKVAATLAQCKWIIVPTSFAVKLYTSGNFLFKMSIDSSSGASIGVKAWTEYDKNPSDAVACSISWLMVAQRV